MEWLLAVIRLFFDFIPRPHIVTPDQVRVVFRFGRWPKVRSAGWYLEWPVFYDFQTVQISEEVLEGQFVVDGKKSRWMARYKAVDALKSITVVTNAEESTEAAINASLVASRGEVDLDQINELTGLWGCDVVDVLIVSSGIFTIDVHG